ncbi:MAG: MobF family relaxase [Solirubrobacteraceae bacterium]
MMRPHAIRGQGALDYYLSLVPGVEGHGAWIEARSEGQGQVEDYYLPVDEAPGRWWGEGRDALGLDGEATREQMSSLLEGRNPASGEQLGQGVRKDGVAAYDLTFSAPKTVSILAAIAGGDSERAVIAAHDRAVEAALSMLEERASTRAGKNGTVRMEVGGLTTLLVRHRTSRSLDPQLHTHALVFAKVQGPDGRWRALDARIAYRAQQTFGAVYQSVLRSELTRSLGVRWGEVSEHGQADIEELEELVDVFSKRHKQVKELAAVKLADWRQRHPGAEPTERQRARMTLAAAKESRPAKDRAREGSELRAEWLETARARGFDLERIQDLVLGRQQTHEPTDERELREQAILARQAVAALSERKSAWTIEDVEREVAARISSDVGRSPLAQRRAIEALAEKTVRHLCLDLAREGRSDRVAAAERALSADPGIARYTTRALIEQEQGIVRWLSEASAQGGSAALPTQLTIAMRRIGAREGPLPAIDPEQMQGAALAAGTHRACAISGPAGAGKTTMLKLAVQVIEQRGARVLGLAPTAVAASRLAEATGVRCETVDRYLAQRQRGVNSQRPAGRGHTLIVDEAGMLSTPRYEALLRAATADGLRVVLVGDERQLSPVGRGGMFEHARELLPTVELSRAHRFAHAWEAEASLALRKGDVRALDPYIARERVLVGKEAAVHAGMLKAWWQAHSEGRSYAFSAPTREQVRELNARAQGLRIAAGEIGAGRRSENRHGEAICTGDLVATRRNAREDALLEGSQVRNRETWRVMAVAEDGALHLRKDNGSREVSVPGAYAHEHVELAYFRTTHGVQGVSVEVGATLVDERADFRSVYVGLTRGSEQNTVYLACAERARGREVLERALERDRADLGVLAQAREIDRLSRDGGGRRLDAIERARERDRQRELARGGSVRQSV